MSLYFSDVVRHQIGVVEFVVFVDASLVQFVMVVVRVVQIEDVEDVLPALFLVVIHILFDDVELGGVVHDALPSWWSAPEQPHGVEGSVDVVPGGVGLAAD